jgi:periplasmic divalent cation tolerance protein
MHIVVHITAGSKEEAEGIARALVEERIVACANLIPGVTSVYTWEGKTCKEEEVLIEAKTLRSRLDALLGRVKELHSYDVPEIVAMPIEGGSPAYLDWVTGSTREEGPRDS